MTDQTVASWRRERRAILLGTRQAMPLDARQHAAEIVAAKLDAIVTKQGSATVGLYWPIKQEINLLSWAAELARRGVAVCLPVVVTPKAPLEYWRWTQGEALGRGIWNIPVPARRDVVLPDLMLAPVVGFDRANYRLGYGGGFFDRTLASLRQRPVVVGIGYEFSRLETIFPQPYDIPMDEVLTERTAAPPPSPEYP